MSLEAKPNKDSWSLHNCFDPYIPSITIIKLEEPCDLINTLALLLGLLGCASKKSLLI